MEYCIKLIIYDNFNTKDLKEEPNSCHNQSRGAEGYRGEFDCKWIKTDQFLTLMI